MRRFPRKLHLVASAALVISVLASGLGTASAQSEWTGEAKEVGPGPRAQFPEDRYALAGGCYAVSSGGSFVDRSEDGFAAGASALEAAEPFRFQATDLGRYMLFGTASDFLAASEGAIAEATYGVTGSIPGQIVGGVVLEQSDVAADEVARSEPNRASGRGASVVAAPEPDELADWEVVGSGTNTFKLKLPATDQALAVEAGGLALVPAAQGDDFGFELTTGCATFPEVDVNIDGPVLGGQTSFQETRGFIDLHLHGMAYEFLGGRARCAKPWSRYGVTKALLDCADHHPGGEAAVLEQLLSKTQGQGHAPDGWPTFEGWPRHNYLTHEQLYYKWLERAWRGGLRLYTNLLVDNEALCKIYPYKDRHAVENQCNEMDGVRLQYDRIRQLQDYIDAQSGGPGEGWFRIVTDPFQAREVINDGKLAVVLGIEVSTLFDCGLTPDQPCTKEKIDDGLDEVEEMGVTQMELVNKFDSGLSGVTGDGGDTGLIVNQGNLAETGHYWKMDTCPEDAGHAHDKLQHNVHDSPEEFDERYPDEFTGRDSLVASILATAGTTGAAPAYPPGPHCNELGLTDLGAYTIRQMAERGIIFDPDHMSAKARTSAMDIIDELGYSGVVSSHSWADDTIYPRIYEAGGVVTPSDAKLGGFIDDYEKSKSWADDRFFFGFGYGSDVNGFSSSAPPIEGTTVEYPFEGFGGATVDRQVSGERMYNINIDGVAHYGLYTDWIQGLRQMNAGLYEDMTRGSEAYLQMWERAFGIAGDACRTDIPDLTQEQVSAIQPGDSYVDVLEDLGQPTSRVGYSFVYCVDGGTTATITFGEDGRVPGGTDPEPKPCPPKGRPVTSGDGHPSPRDNEVPGRACGRR